MQVFLGGAYAGKRAAVRARCAYPIWHSAYQGAAFDEWPQRLEERAQRLEKWPQRLEADQTLVLEGWECWLLELLTDQTDDDELRRTLIDQLDALIAAEQRGEGQVALILLEMGCGIVPLDRHQRRLRDHAGWLAQAAIVRAEQVHYVWHGLVRSLPLSDDSD